MTTTSKKLISFLTGTRADFGKLKPLIQSVADSGELRYEVVATGMHMLKKYGLTIGEIYKSGFDNVFPIFNQESSSAEKMDITLANTIIPLSHYLNEKQPDLLIIHGDRIETLAGAIAGCLNNFRVAHVEGGELSGTIDESIRHAISKLVPLHLVSNVSARSRLIQMGELPESIFVIGSPEVDIMTGNTLPSIDAVKNHYKIPFEKYAILVYHPVTTEIEDIDKNIKELVDAVDQLDNNFIIIEPNNDIGAERIRYGFSRLKGRKNIKIFPSLRFEYYLALLQNCEFFIGNSSSGVREAPVFGVPTLNMGTRQHHRSSAASIVNVKESAGAIVQAARNIGSAPKSKSNIFGDGNAARRFSEVISQVQFWELPLQKQFVGLDSSGERSVPCK